MELIKKYFPTLTALQIDRIAQLKPLYEDWNAKINVISRKDIDEFYCNHVLHSLSIAKLYPFNPGDKVLDIGTGGGFPGIPLAICFPDTSFTLVDSIRKKTTVINGVVEALDLQNVTVLNDRFENITERYSKVVSRAVASADKLVKYTKNALANDGKHIFLKGGDLTIEKNEFTAIYKNAKWLETNLYESLPEPFFETKKIITVSW